MPIQSVTTMHVPNTTSKPNQGSNQPVATNMRKLPIPLQPVLEDETVPRAHLVEAGPIPSHPFLFSTQLSMTGLDFISALLVSLFFVDRHVLLSSPRNNAHEVVL